MRKRIECELNIIKTEFPGMGVAILEGEKVLVKNALPGQKVLGRLKKKKTSIEADIIEVLEDVDYKIAPKCEHFGLCGGCSHQFISYEKQLELKFEQVMDLFKAADITGFECLGIEGSPKDTEYRNKMEYTFGDMEKGGELNLGMHAKGVSFGILTVNKCTIVDEDFRAILTEVVNYFKKTNLPYYRVMTQKGYLRNLVVRKAENTGEILVNIVTTSQENFDLSELVAIIEGLSYKGTLKGIIHTINDSLSDMVQPDEVKVLYGQDYMTEKLLGLNFKISPFSFFQTNSKGAERLYSIVREFMGDTASKTVFDLYCGTGTIGQIVAQKAKQVVGVELIEEAVIAARENAALNGLENCKFIAGDVAKVIQTVNQKPDIIILDPPRPGVHPVALDYVIKFKAPQIIYVSCNPKTLVTDLKVLTRAGYIVEKVKVMDMFPQTGHVETVVKLYKK